jgi:hypothetical protein
VSEVAFVITDLFEVFSPKAFKGMRGSTPLTRHFAAQGFKIKLRADGTLGKMWVVVVWALQVSRTGGLKTWACLTF